MGSIGLKLALLIAVLFFWTGQSSAEPIKDGAINLVAGELVPGKSFDLTGQWLYKPGYEIKASEHPETNRAAGGYLPVGVPQFLNRINWWLDDSEDFKRSETARLQKLGFDTDRAADGWYHLILNLPKIPKDRRLYLKFDGVAMQCKAFMNGEPLGVHAGMFSRFEFDLTPHLKAGSNLLAIFVSMEKIPPSSLEMGEAVTVNLTASKVKSLSKGMYGPLAPGQENRSYDLHGIWQPVKLVVRGRAKLDDVWFIPGLDGAEIRLSATGSPGLKDAMVKARFTEAGTTNVLADLEPERLRMNPTAQETLWLRQAHPRLWTPADPNLYLLRVTLESTSGELLDEWSHHVGFKTFEARGDKLFLNGKPYWLRGANHLPYGKNPWEPPLARKLIQFLHDGNIRVTRTHATPWNEAWLDAADEIGLGVSLEGIRPWALAGKIGPTPDEFFKHWLMENEDVVTRCRNHPSVLIYTVGNEMMLKDTKNLEKWQQLSAVTEQTRRVDPTRPVVVSSEYQRDPDTYKSLIEPNKLDDGDIDDIHQYKCWYRESAFASDSLFQSEMKKHLWSRPFIGQEMSSGYPDLDNGLPVLRYTRDLVTPQAWVGHYAYPGNDPQIFLEHHRAVTKRWAEQLRFQRQNYTAGFMIFATECWFAHSYDADKAAPYPVYEGMKEAWAPVGLALGTAQRRFYGGEDADTTVFITNDDEKFQSLREARLELVIEDDATREILATNALGTISGLAYYQTTNVPIHFRLPATTSGRKKVNLITRLLAGNVVVSRTTDRCEMFARENSLPSKSDVPVLYVGLGKDLESLVVKSFSTVFTHPEANKAPPFGVILFKGTNASEYLALGSPIRAQVEAGATAVLLDPGDAAAKLFPKNVLDVKAALAEFADWLPVAGTELSDGLEPMDIKWWTRKNDWRMLIGHQSHRLKADENTRELLRFIPPHSYIPADKVPEQYRTVFFEIVLGKGRLWVCDLDLENSVGVDPAADLFARNLLRAAANPESTRNLKPVPSHEAMLRGELPGK
jgi:hypothetical protein